MINDRSYSYKIGTFYQDFMCRSYQSSDFTQEGMHGSYMQNLIDAERGETLMKELGSFEEQFDKVQKYIQNALNQYLEMDFTNDIKGVVEVMKMKVDLADTTYELMGAIDTVMKVTQTVKNY